MHGHTDQPFRRTASAQEEQVIQRQNGGSAGGYRCEADYEVWPASGPCQIAANRLRAVPGCPAIMVLRRGGSIRAVVGFLRRSHVAEVRDRHSSSARTGSRRVRPTS
jgi:hypothetical protein